MFMSSFFLLIVLPLDYDCETLHPRILLRVVKQLVLPCTWLIASNRQGIEPKAVWAICSSLNLSEDFVSLALASRASDETSLEVEISEGLALRRRFAAELVDDGTRRDIRRVGNGVAQATIRRNVNLLSSWHNHTEGKTSIASSENCGVSRWASIANDLNWAVGRGTRTAEVELSTACCQRL